MSESNRILVELVEAQEKALQTADELVTVKSELITLLEDEIKMHKRNNILICTMLIALSILLTIFLGLSCIL